ncbi:MAG TPA: MCE family protein [Jatrophihabitans sp.]|jgi:phospholipid/cholesterol/gamma-HCH transport system substrate-binding protein
MSRSLRGLTAPLVKSLVFIVVTVVATGTLLATITNQASSGAQHAYHAIFSDVTALNTGDDVRMAGVRIGTVTGISVVNRRDAQVSFEISSNVALASTVKAMIRFRNLVGQRYIELDQGAGSPDQQWPASKTIGLDRTSPALDLTALFNGFQPLFSALDPKQINALSYEIVQIFQNQGGTVDDLITHTATLTNALADRDHIIGAVIDNLTQVLKTVNAHRSGLSTTVVTLQQLVSGLARDRGAIGSAVTSLAGLTTSVSGLLRAGRPALRRSIASLGKVSANLANNAPTVEHALRTLPTKLDRVGRLASYGSWINSYLCSITGRIPVPAGYYGGVGVQPVAARCQS